MVSPNAEDTIVDPACGSGGFLIHALQLVQDCKGIKDLKGYCQNHLWGFDFDSRAVQVAKALMLIAGDGNCNILHLNSLARSAVNQELFKLPSSEVLPSLTIEDVLRSTRKRFTGFDIVLTNPPFAGEIREPNILETYELAANHTRIERDILFLERCIELLRPGGRLCIVLPHNKFAGSNWKYAREWLAERLRIVGVLSLGRNTFLPHTHQKTNVLFGIKRSSSEKPNKGERIIFMVSEKDAKDSRGQILERPKVNSDDPAWVRADHDLNTLVERFHKFVKEERISWGTR